MNAGVTAKQRREKRKKLEMLIEKFQRQGVKIGFVKNIQLTEGLHANRTYSKSVNEGA